MKGAYVHEQSSYRNWICKHFHPFSSIEWHGSSQKIIQMKTVPMSDGKLGIWMISGDFYLIFDRCLLTRDKYCNYTMHKLCRVSESNTQDVSSVWLWFDVFVALAFLALWLSWCFLSLFLLLFSDLELLLVFDLIKSLFSNCDFDMVLFSLLIGWVNSVSRFHITLYSFSISVLFFPLIVNKIDIFGIVLFNFESLTYSVNWFTIDFIIVC